MGYVKSVKLITLVALACSAQVAHADFVGGIPAGWACTGNCGALGANGDVTLSPLGNAKYGYVSTSQGVNGTSPFALGSETTGSKLVSTAFTANAGDALNFYFNYVTSDGSGFSDYAFSRLLNAADNSQAAILFTARTKPTGNIIPGFGLPNADATIPVTPIIPNASNWSALGANSGECYAAGCGSTGWVPSTFEIGVAGSYLLEFGVVNWVDSAFQSGLAFDGITVGGKPIDPPSAVPLPASLPLTLSGLAMLGFFRRKVKK